jgi:hypothetical protein
MRPPQRRREAGGCWKAAVHVFGADVADLRARRSWRARIGGGGCVIPRGILRIDRRLGRISLAATLEP